MSPKPECYKQQNLLSNDDQLDDKLDDKLHSIETCASNKRLLKGRERRCGRDTDGFLLFSTDVVLLFSTFIIHRGSIPF